MIPKRFIFLGGLCALTLLLLILIPTPHPQPNQLLSSSETLWPSVTDTDKAKLASDTESQNPQTKPVLMAKVNGEPIYKDEVEAGIKQRSFGITAKDALEARLDSLVSRLSIKQYLKTQGIKLLMKR